MGLGDILKKVGKGIAGNIPIVGGAASALFDILGGQKADKFNLQQQQMLNDMLQGNRQRYDDWAAASDAANKGFLDQYGSQLAGPQTTTSSQWQNVNEKMRKAFENPEGRKMLMGLLESNLRKTAAGDPARERQMMSVASEDAFRKNQAARQAMNRAGAGSIGTNLAGTTGAGGDILRAKLAAQGMDRADAAQARGELGQQQIAGAGTDRNMRMRGGSTTTGPASAANLGLLMRAMQPTAPYQENIPMAPGMTPTSPWLQGASGLASGLSQYFMNKQDKKRQPMTMPGSYAGSPIDPNVIGGL